MGLRNGLIHYYSLEETSGDAKDRLGSLDLTNVSITRNADGKVSKAYSFSGTKNTHLVGTGINYGDEFSVSFWVKPSDLSVQEAYGRTIISSSPTSGSGYPIWILVSGQKVRVSTFQPSTTANTSSKDVLVVGQWTHVVVSAKRNDNSEVYINGVLDKTYTSGNQAGNTGLCIGELRPDRSISYAGILDEVGFWNRKLTSSEVNKLYNSGNGVGYEDIVDLDTGRVLHYELNEESGTTVLDTSGLGNNGTNNGALIKQAGIQGYGYEFNSANNSYLETPNHSSLAPGTMSAFMWVKPYNFDSATATTFLSKRNGPTRGYFFFILKSANTVHLDINNATQTRWNSGYTPPLNTWTHLGYTYDGDKARLYVNGVLQATSGSFNKTFAPSTNPLRIGRDTSSTYLYSGLMDEVSIWDRPLMDSEVLKLYEETSSQVIQLDVSVVGNGSVDIYEDKEEYDENEPITLTAIPNPGSRFVGWSGDLVSEDNPKIVIMNTSKEIIATFEEYTKAISKTIYLDPIPAKKATMFVTTSDSNEDFIYGLSNDGGKTFEEVQNGVEHTFKSEGNEVKWAIWGKKSGIKVTRVNVQIN